jgi:hypothetical protein
VNVLKPGLTSSLRYLSLGAASQLIRWPYQYLAFCCGCSILGTLKWNKTHYAKHKEPISTDNSYAWSMSNRCMTASMLPIDLYCLCGTSYICLGSQSSFSLKRRNEETEASECLCRCAAPTCKVGIAADNYPNGFREPDGEIWRSCGSAEPCAYLLNTVAYML